MGKDLDHRYDKIFKDPKRLDSFFDAVPIPCLILERKENDFILVDFNKEMLKETKGNINGVIGYKTSHIFEDKKDIIDYINACYKEKTQKILERFYDAYTYENREYLKFTFEFVSPNFVLMFIDSIQERVEAQHLLKQERDKYRKLVYNLPIVIYSVLPDVKATFEFVSNKIKDWTGYDPEEFIGDSLVNLEIIHPDDLKRSITEYLKAFKNIEKYDLEYRIIHKTAGDIRYVRDYALPITDKNNKILKYNGILIDITERKKAEKKLKESRQRLRESEEKFRTIADQSSLGIQIVQNGELKYINKKARSFTGITEKDLMDISFYEVMELIHPEDRSKVKRKFAQRLKSNSKTFPSYEFRLLVDHEVKWLESYSKKINYEGTPADLIIFADITERKKAEQSLKETAALFKNLAEQSSTGIQIVQSGKIKYVNKKWVEIFELEIKDLKNKPAIVGKKYIHPDDLEFVKEQMELRKKRARNAKGRYEFRAITTSGKVKWLDIFYKDITYQGRAASFVTIVDITEKKQIEKELIQLNKLKSQFLRRTSHELKTPLISIKGYADLLIELYEEKLPSKFIKIVGEIKDGCLRLEDLIKDLLKGAQLESGKVKLRRSKENLSFLIKFTAKEFEHLAKKRNQTIKTDIHENMVTYFEKERIYEVLKNLISNAIKYTPENGKIEIRSEITDKKYIISIKDTGIGFTDEEKKQVFTQFGKIERYGQGFDLGIDGTGLGLYISKKIIQLHGGEIWMESQGRNRGSTFYFSILKKM